MGVMMLQQPPCYSFGFLNTWLINDRLDCRFIWFKLLAKYNEEHVSVLLCLIFVSETFYLMSLFHKLI